MAGKLYVVPTPIGNLADMTPRAIEVLKTVDMIYAEDTRTSSTLTARFGIATPMKSFHKFNEHQSLDAIVSQLQQGRTIALISDAGTPAISDPGFLLTRACRLHDIPVETLPGPTAFVPALVNSGLPCDRFFFEGFLPPKKGRATRMQFLATLPATFIVYESPLRTLRTLTELAGHCGPDRPAAVCREISKIHDTTLRGTLRELIDHFTLNNPKGEIVIVVEGLAHSTEKKTHRNKYKEETN